MKIQLEHLGCVVMPRSISSNKSKYNDENNDPVFNGTVEMIYGDHFKYHKSRG